MRTTLDIPDDVYRELKIKAAREGKPVRQIVLSGIHKELQTPEKKPAAKRFRVPVIRSARPGTLHLTNEQIDDILASS
jgi:plasmid stability protein